MDDQNVRSVYAIDKLKRIVLYDDGSIAQFDVLLNEDGDVTEDVDEAIYALVCFPDGEDDFVKFADFGPARFN